MQSDKFVSTRYISSEWKLKFNWYLTVNIRYLEIIFPFNCIKENVKCNIAQCNVIHCNSDEINTNISRENTEKLKNLTLNLTLKLTLKHCICYLKSNSSLSVCRLMRIVLCHSNVIEIQCKMNAERERERERAKRSLFRCQSRFHPACTSSYWKCLPWIEFRLAS